MFRRFVIINMVLAGLWFLLFGLSVYNRHVADEEVKQPNQVAA
jgi:hypothetical protein